MITNDIVGDHREARLVLALHPTDPDACYQVVLTQGRCLLAGVGVEADHAPLDRVTIGIATCEAMDHVRQAIGAAVLLGAEWDGCVDPSEAENLCVRLIDARHDAWAVTVALAAAGVESADLTHAVGTLDTAMRAQIEVLATMAGTNYLANQRAALAAPYCEPPPWWLGGPGSLLEATMAETIRVCDARTDRARAVMLRDRLERVLADRIARRVHTTPLGYSPPWPPYWEAQSDDCLTPGWYGATGVLAPDRVEAVVTGGVAVLTDAEVADLLDAPADLEYVADVVDSRLTDHWLDVYARVGTKLFSDQVADAAVRDLAAPDPTN